MIPCEPHDTRNGKSCHRHQGLYSDHQQQKCYTACYDIHGQQLASHTLDVRLGTASMQTISTDKISFGL